MKMPYLRTTSLSRKFCRSGKDMTLNSDELSRCNSFFGAGVSSV